MARAVLEEGFMFLSDDAPLESTDRLDRLVSQHWVTLANLGWRGYREFGRGFVCVQQNEASWCIPWEGSVSYSVELGGLDEELKETAKLAVSNYNPDEEIVVCFEPLNDEHRVVAFRSQIARPSEAADREDLPC